MDEKRKYVWADPGNNIGILTPRRLLIVIILTIIVGSTLGNPEFLRAIGVMSSDSGDNKTTPPLHEPAKPQQGGSLVNPEGSGLMSLSMPFTDVAEVVINATLSENDASGTDENPA